MVLLHLAAKLWFEVNGPAESPATPVARGIGNPKEQSFDFLDEIDSSHEV